MYRARLGAVVFLKKKNMKTLKILVVSAITAFMLSCGGQRGAANDTTGANGATNGSGKVHSGDNVHSVRN